MRKPKNASGEGMGWATAGEVGERRRRRVRDRQRLEASRAR
jgi:hypothetical protein